jgi:hypothetical protein
MLATCMLRHTPNLAFKLKDLELKLCQWILPLLFAATAIGAASIAGSWINSNSNTGGVTRLGVRSTDQEPFVHAWGAGHPSDCDWSEVQSLLQSKLGSLLRRYLDRLKRVGAPAFMRGKECFGTPGERLED